MWLWWHPLPLHFKIFPTYILLAKPHLSFIFLAYSDIAHARDWMRICIQFTHKNRLQSLWLVFDAYVAFSFYKVFNKCIVINIFNKNFDSIINQLLIEGNGLVLKIIKMENMAISMLLIQRGVSFQSHNLNRHHRFRHICFTLITFRIKSVFF